MEKSLSLSALGFHNAQSVPVSSSVIKLPFRAPGSQANMNTHHSWPCCFMPSDSHSCCSLLIFPSANAYCRETQPGWPPQVVPPRPCPSQLGKSLSGFMAPTVLCHSHLCTSWLCMPVALNCMDVPLMTPLLGLLPCWVSPSVTWRLELIWQCALGLVSRERKRRCYPR